MQLVEYLHSCIGNHLKIMIVTVASFKGGVGKTTTAIHLAAYLQKKGKTLLVDGDPNRSCVAWAKKGLLPFQVVDERQAVKAVRDYKHVVIDTQARPSDEDLQTLIAGCDRLVIPTTPDALSLGALLQMLVALKTYRGEAYKILLTVTPPPPSKEAEEAREQLTDAQLPLFKAQIRRYTAYKKAALEGVTVLDTHDPKAHTAWEDYLAVGKEILK
jgi:chromosome partitioning protein